MTVPINIIQRTNNQQFIFIAHKNPELDDGKYEIEKRFVITGQQYDEAIEIIDDISAGEMIVTFGFQDLAEGQIVAIAYHRHDQLG